jgi:hypothetical protein
MPFRSCSSACLRRAGARSGRPADACALPDRLELGQVCLPWQRGGDIGEWPRDGREGRDMRATTSEGPPERRSRMTLGRDGRVIPASNSSPRVCAAGRVQVHQHAAPHRGTMTVRGHQPPEPTTHTAARPPDHAPPPAFRQILRCSLLPPAGPSAGRCSFPDMARQGSAASTRPDMKVQDRRNPVGRRHQGSG